MKMISTLAIVTGSANVSLLFTTFYNLGQWPPLAYFVLSLAYIGVILIMEYEYRRFKLLRAESVQETASIFHKYIYLFAVGSTVTLIKFVMYVNSTSSELHFEKYLLVRCFDEKHNLYFNLLYYLSNYLLGLLYLRMFRNLYAKFKARLIEGLTLTVSTETFACPVCLSDVPPGFRIVQLLCSHVFHQSCIKKWLAHKNVCPVCKLRVPGVP